MTYKEAVHVICHPADHTMEERRTADLLAANTLVNMQMIRQQAFKEGWNAACDKLIEKWESECEDVDLERCLLMTSCARCVCERTRNYESKNNL